MNGFPQYRSAGVWKEGGKPRSRNLGSLSRPRGCFFDMFLRNWPFTAFTAISLMELTHVAVVVWRRLVVLTFPMVCSQNRVKRFPVFLWKMSTLHPDISSTALTGVTNMSCWFLALSKVSQLNLVISFLGSQEKEKNDN